MTKKEALRYVLDWAEGNVACFGYLPADDLKEVREALAIVRALIDETDD